MKHKINRYEWYKSKERGGTERDLIQLDGYRINRTNYGVYQDGLFKLYLLRHTDMDKEEFNEINAYNKMKKELSKRFKTHKHILTLDGLFEARRKGQKPYYQIEYYVKTEERPTSDDVLNLIDALIEIAEG